MNQSERSLGIFYLLLTALCWGFVASTVKRLAGEVDAYTISFFRVSLAALVFGALFVAQRGDWRRLAWMSPWILLGALGRSGNYLLYNTGLRLTPSNAATLLAPVQAIGTVMLARWLLKERVGGKWPGLLLSLAGLLLIWWNGNGWAVLLDPHYIWGNLLLVLSGLASALQFTSQRALSQRYTGIEISLPVFAISTLITAPFAGVAGGFSRSYSPITWLLLFVLGLVITGGSFFFLGEGYKRCTAATAVVLTNTSTFWTLLWSVVLLHETVSGAMIVGAALGIAGTVSVVRSRDV